MWALGSQRPIVEAPTDATHSDQQLRMRRLAFDAASQPADVYVDSAWVDPFFRPEVFDDLRAVEDAVRPLDEETQQQKLPPRQMYRTPVNTNLVGVEVDAQAPLLVHGACVSKLAVGALGVHLHRQQDATTQRIGVTERLRIGYETVTPIGGRDRGYEPDPTQ